MKYYVTMSTTTHDGKILFTGSTFLTVDRPIESEEDFWREIYGNAVSKINDSAPTRPMGGGSWHLICLVVLPAG